VSLRVESWFSSFVRVCSDTVVSEIRFSIWSICVVAWATSGDFDSSGGYVVKPRVFGM